MATFTNDEIKTAIDIIEQVYEEIKTSSETTLDIDENRYYTFDSGSACEGMIILSDILRRRIGMDFIYDDIAVG